MRFKDVRLVLAGAVVGALLVGVGAFVELGTVQAQTAHEPSSSITPAAEAVAVTPSDATTYSPPCRSLFVGGAGTLVVDMARTGTDISFEVPAGALVPVRAVKVKAATDATLIVCLY